MSNVNTKSVSSSYRNELKKPPYPVAQQVKFLHLAAEIELLLQQIQTKDRQHLTAANYNAANNKRLPN